MKEILILNPKEVARAVSLWIGENRKDLCSSYTHVRVLNVPKELQSELFNENEELGLANKDKEREHKRLIRMGNKDEDEEKEKSV